MIEFVFDKLQTRWIYYYSLPRLRKFNELSLERSNRTNMVKLFKISHRVTANVWNPSSNNRTPLLKRKILHLSRNFNYEITKSQESIIKTRPSVLNIKTLKMKSILRLWLTAGQTFERILFSWKFSNLDENNSTYARLKLILCSKIFQIIWKLFVQKNVPRKELERVHLPERINKDIC